MPKKTMASLERKIESLEANLAEERANHAITTGERDGFKEKSESLEEHLEAAFKDLEEAGKHLDFHHRETRRRAMESMVERFDADSDMMDAFKYSMMPIRYPRQRPAEPHIITVETPTAGAVLLAAFAGTFAGAAVLLFGLWLVVHYAL